MRWRNIVIWATLLIMGGAVAGLAAKVPEIPPAVACVDGIPGRPACTASKKDRKQAKSAFVRGLKLQNSKHLDEAFTEFEHAAELVPQDLEYVTARELARQQLVFNHIQHGNASLNAGRQVEAMAEFRSALQLDPQNQFARERLLDALGSWKPKTAAPLELVAEADEPQLAPAAERPAIFHYRGDSRGLLSQVAAAFGVDITIDDSVASRQVRFDIDGAGFYPVMRAVSALTKTFWVPLEARQIFVAADNPENHRFFDRMGMRTFHVEASTPQELTDVVNTMRAVFEIKFVSQQPQSGTLMIRAPREVLEAATTFLQGLDQPRPEVLLELRTYEVSRTLTRNFGVHIPNQFKLFNIPAGALAALGGQNIQNLINQLISSGGINQANSTAISALLAQLQSQQNSIFSQPLATFGGGLTLMGLSLDQLSAALSLNESSVTSLEHATLRGLQGKDVNFHLGTRYPILNATFAPIFNTAAIAQVIQNNTFTPAFPSFNYEDLGLTVKAKPIIHSTSDVSLELELQIRSLGTQNLNGVPVISNREFKGSITLRDGEPAVVAGSVSRTEVRTLSGIPGMAKVPGLNKVTTSNSKEDDEDELLVVITPHVISRAEHDSDGEIWMGKGQ